MSLRKHYEDENYNPADLSSEEENFETLSHRRKIRRSIEEKLERKRLREEIDELDGDFDWDEDER